MAGLIIPSQPLSEKTKKAASKTNLKDMSPEKRDLKNNIISLQNALIAKNKDTEQSHTVT